MLTKLTETHIMAGTNCQNAYYNISQTNKNFSIFKILEAKSEKTRVYEIER